MPDMCGVLYGGVLSRVAYFQWVHVRVGQFVYPNITIPKDNPVSHCHSGILDAIVFFTYVASIKVAIDRIQYRIPGIGYVTPNVHPKLLKPIRSHEKKKLLHKVQTDNV